ncbi:hypothetical protein Acr_23g0015830 [Actinidia rufa]|uniref:Uncharacterized protein n=1 Tax=Actinidia rufa TaxID=165716 RepID=A0A7J0GR09_9ERIC|nr:hypothetical protein Acr_23g0015830 [Actinidia rufa]
MPNPHRLLCFQRRDLQEVGSCGGVVTVEGEEGCDIEGEGEGSGGWRGCWQESDGGSGGDEVMWPWVESENSGGCRRRKWWASGRNSYGGCQRGERVAEGCGRGLWWRMGCDGAWVVTAHKLWQCTCLLVIAMETKSTDVTATPSPVSYSSGSDSTAGSSSSGGLSICLLLFGSMGVARFLSGLPSSFDDAWTQILGDKELPSLSEVLSCLRQDTLLSAAPSPTDRSALVAFVESSRPSRPYPPPGFGHGWSNHPSNDYPRDNRGFSHGGRDSRGVGHGRGRGSRFCTHCNQDNHIVDRCWDIHGHPTTHQATVVPEDDVVTISADEYQRLLTAPSSPATATLAQKSAYTACTASPSPWVINSCTSTHMIDISSILSDISLVGRLYRVTVVNGSDSLVTGSGTTSLCSLSLSLVLGSHRMPSTVLGGQVPHQCVPR